MTTTKDFCTLHRRVLDLAVELGSGKGSVGERLLGFGWAQPEKEPWIVPHAGLIPTRRAVGVWCYVVWSQSKAGALGGPSPSCLKLAVGTWNVTCLVGKELELSGQI